MTRFKQYFFIFLMAMAIAPSPLVIAQVQTVPTVSRETLQQQIQDRAQKLSDLNQKIQATTNNLVQVQQQGESLKKELKTIDVSVQQLNLNIQSDQFQTQKLSLEIQSLNYDLQDISSSIDDKKKAIVAVLQELQKSDRDNLLIMLLRNDNLSAGITEAQSLDDLRSQLGTDIDNLSSLSADYQNKLQNVGDKKAQIAQHQENLQNRKAIVEQQKQERQNLLATTKDKESAYHNQLADLKKQQDQVSDEIGQIEDQLRATFNESVLPIKRPGVFGWPVQMAKDGGVGHITQHFGQKSYLYRGKPHNGLDIGVPLGTPVFAAADGVVLAVDNNDINRWRKYQYGKYVLIKHSSGFATLYGHLSLQTAYVGQVVKRGDLVGYSGKTGYATGPHLHFGLYWAPSLLMKSIPPAAGLVPVGVVINPEDYL